MQDFIKFARLYSFMSLKENINPDKLLEDVKETYGRALPFAVNIGYTTPETITFLIGKAGRQEIALSNLQNKGLETNNTPQVNSEENK